MKKALPTLSFLLALSTASWGQLAVIQQINDDGYVEFLTCQTAIEEDTNTYGLSQCRPAFVRHVVFSLDEFDFSPGWRKAGATGVVITVGALTLAGGYAGYFTYALYTALPALPQLGSITPLAAKLIGSTGAALVALGAPATFTTLFTFAKKSNPVYMWRKANVAKVIHKENLEHTQRTIIAIEDEEELEDFLSNVKDLLNVDALIISERGQGEIVPVTLTE